VLAHVRRPPDNPQVVFPRCGIQSDVFGSVGCVRSARPYGRNFVALSPVFDVSVSQSSVKVRADRRDNMGVGLPPLEFTECMTDSPYFRENLHKHERELEKTNQQIKRIIKEVKDVLNTAKRKSHTGAITSLN
jgi:hypothetical protein